MSNLTAWINDTLYPSLFEVIPGAFPEHSFQEFSGGWRSKTYLSGDPHSRIDKTVITKQAPGLILEQGGPVKSLIDYVMDRDRVDSEPKGRVWMKCLIELMDTMDVGHWLQLDERLILNGNGKLVGFRLPGR